MFNESFKPVIFEMKFTLLYLLFQESPEQSIEQHDYNKFSSKID